MDRFAALDHSRRRRGRFTMRAGTNATMHEHGAGSNQAIGSQDT